MDWLTQTIAACLAAFVLSEMNYNKFSTKPMKFIMKKITISFPQSCILCFNLLLVSRFYYDLRCYTNCNNNMFLNNEITQWKNLKFHSNVLSDLPPVAFPCNYLQTARVPCCPRYIYSKITQPRTLLPTLGDQVRGGSTSADLAVLALERQL